MSMHSEMDLWRYRIAGQQYANFDKDTQTWTPGFMFESDIYWDEDEAVKAMEKMRELFPGASMRIQKTRDRWEIV